MPTFSQLDTTANPFAGRAVFSGDTEFWVESYDEELGWGIASTYRTGYTVMFRIAGNAKPVACRQFRPELTCEVFEIETVATGGSIDGVAGERRPGRWRLAA